MRAPARAVALAAAVATLAAAPAARGDPALRPSPSGDRSYGESYTFVADLPDGGYVQVSLAFMNFAPGTKAVCRAVVASPRAPAWSASARVGASGVAWRDGPDETLSVGPCSATVQADRTVVEAPLEGATVRLRFEGRPAHLPFPDTHVALEGGGYATEVLLYRARVEATLAVPGSPARQVEGAGYADHSRSTMPPRDLAVRWVRFRALRGDRGLLVLGRQARDGAFDPVWACAGPARCTRYGSFALERSGAAAASAFRIELDRQGGRLDLRSGALLLRDAPVEDLGVLGKVVAPFVGSPVTYVYRGTAGDGTAPPLEGLLEIELALE